MKFHARSTVWAKRMFEGMLQPDPIPQANHNLGTWVRRGLALMLSALLIMVPMGQEAFAQSYPATTQYGVQAGYGSEGGYAQGQYSTQAGYDQGGYGYDQGGYPQAGYDQGAYNQPAYSQPGYSQDGYEQAGYGDPNAVQAQPLSADQLDQLVAPIALYPDALVAQILVAATYPTQVVEADRWRQGQGNAPAEQIASVADTRDWDPSVKALTAFPTVLAQMDRNLQWTTDLGNAYYNQPQDVMDSIQAMRQKAENAGQLRSTEQQVVTNEGGEIAIQPANPAVVYVPVYNPWVVYGSPLPIYPGYYYAPPPGVFWGGLAIGFCAGVGVGVFSHWGWGWNRWGLGWRNHAVFYNHAHYFTHSRTVINRGFYRPGGQGRGYGRGPYGRGGEGYRANYGHPGYGHNGGYNGRPYNSRPAGDYGRPGVGYRGSTVNRAGVAHPPMSGYRTPVANRPIVQRPGTNYGHSAPAVHPAVANRTPVVRRPIPERPGPNYYGHSAPAANYGHATASANYYGHSAPVNYGHSAPPANYGHSAPSYGHSAPPANYGHSMPAMHGGGGGYSTHASMGHGPAPASHGGGHAESHSGGGGNHGGGGHGGGNHGGGSHGGGHEGHGH